MLNTRFKEVFPTNTKDIFNFNPYYTPKMNVSVKHTITFHKNKHKIKKIIMKKTDKHEIIHGETAVRKYVPDKLHRTTQDIDVYSKTPRKDAVQVEKALDKHFGGNYFYVEKGQHPGTWRVKAFANKESYADYTKPESKIPYKTINGKKYVTKKFIKNKIKETLNNPESEFRHAKDLDTLNRLKATDNKRRIF